MPTVAPLKPIGSIIICPKLPLKFLGEESRIFPVNDRNDLQGLGIDHEILEVQVIATVDITISSRYIRLPCRTSVPECYARWGNHNPTELTQSFRAECFQLREQYLVDERKVIPLEDGKSLLVILFPAHLTKIFTFDGLDGQRLYPATI